MQSFLALKLDMDEEEFVNGLLKNFEFISLVVT